MKVKVTEELEKIILELRLNNKLFGPRRIRFRLKRKFGVSLGTKTIYNLSSKETQAECSTVCQTKKKIQAL